MAKEKTYQIIFSTAGEEIEVSFSDIQKSYVDKIVRQITDLMDEKTKSEVLDIGEGNKVLISSERMKKTIVSLIC